VVMCRPSLFGLTGPTSSVLKNLVLREIKTKNEHTENEEGRASLLVHLVDHRC
jgi:hypothetical protein